MNNEYVNPIAYNAIKDVLKKNAFKGRERVSFFPDEINDFEKAELEREGHYVEKVHLKNNRNYEHVSTIVIIKKMVH